MIKLLKPEHQKRIEQLQPYNGISSPPLKTIDLTKRSGLNSPLLWLEEVNNADKHRIIQVVGVRPGGFSTTYWGEGDHFVCDGNPFSILEDGAKFGEADTDMQVDVQILPLIAFGDKDIIVFKQPVCGLLDLVATTVSEIVESFASEFK